MTYQNPFLGPFIPVVWPAIPSNVIVTVPDSDDTIDIGTSVKRYRNLYATDVHTTSLEATTITATTMSLTTLSTKTVADLVTGPASATSGNLAIYNGTTGKIISQSGKSAADVVVGPASVVAGNIAEFSDPTGKHIGDSSVAITDVVLGPASAVDGHVTLYDGTSGKLIKDSGTPFSDVVVLTDLDDLVTGPASAVNNNLTSFDGTSGKLVKDSGLAASSFAGLTRLLFSQAEDAKVSGTTSETSVLLGSAVYGSTTVAAPQLENDVFKFDFFYQNLTATPNNMTLRLKLNGSTLISSTVGFNNATVVEGNFTATMSIRPLSAGSNALCVYVTHYWGNFTGYETYYSTIGAYDPSITNTFDITVQFTGADGIIHPRECFLTRCIAG